MILNLVLPVLCATPVLSQSLDTALRNNGLTNFADWIRNDPAFVLNETSPQAVIHAPTNSAFQTGGGNASIARRSDLDEARKRCHVSNAVAPSLKRDTLVGPGRLFETFLHDPTLVNLRNGLGQIVVERSGTLFSGVGKNTSVISPDIPFDPGGRRLGAPRLTLPEDLSSTLTSLGLTQFRSALERANLLETAGSTAGITVLAANDAAVLAGNNSTSSNGDALKQHILVDLPAYTPLLRDGATYRTLAGTNVTVTFRDNSYFVNDARIVSADAVIKNGVLHTLDKMLAQTPLEFTGGVTRRLDSKRSAYALVAVAFAAVSGLLV